MSRKRFLRLMGLWSKGSEETVDGAFGPEGCGLLTQAGCVEGLYRKVLRFDGPQGRGVWYHPMGR